MSFNHLSSLESQPTQYRDEPETRDDQEFNSFAENLSVQLFGLTSSISRLSQQINLLGTKRDTERDRERVSDLLEETRDGFKDIGEKMRKLAAWEDVNVWLPWIKCKDYADYIWISHHRSTPSKSSLASSKPRVANSKPFSGKPSRSNGRQRQQQDQQ